MQPEGRSLDELAILHGVDKSSRFHDYAVVYERYFSPIRFDVRRILEIGVMSGASLRLWADYFPGAAIHGVDIDPRCAVHQDGIRFFVHIGDQSDPDFLNAVVDAMGAPPDVVLDDGSHLPAHQIASLKALFPRLRPGGIYVVEDLCTSYWPEYHGGLRRSDTSIEFLKSLVDEVNFHGLRVDGRVDRRPDLLIPAAQPETPLGTDVESIHFHNSTALLLKRASP